MNVKLLDWVPCCEELKAFAQNYDKLVWLFWKTWMFYAGFWDALTFDGKAVFGVAVDEAIEEDPEANEVDVCWFEIV